MNKVLIVVLSIFTAFTAFAQDNRRTEMKSGIITMASELLGREVITKKYFDDYGVKSSEFTSATFYENGERKETLLYGRARSGDCVFFVDHLNKALRVTAKDSDIINFLGLTDDIIEKYQIKRLGEEEVCGKPCTKYSLILDNNGKRAKGQAWVWKGITLKTRVKSFPLEYEIEAIDIQLDVPIDSSVFVVPDYPLVSSPQEAK